MLQFGPSSATIFSATSGVTRERMLKWSTPADRLEMQQRIVRRVGQRLQRIQVAAGPRKGEQWAADRLQPVNRRTQLHLPWIVDVERKLEPDSADTSSIGPNANAARKRSARMRPPSARPSFRRCCGPRDKFDADRRRPASPDNRRRPRRRRLRRKRPRGSRDYRFRPAKEGKERDDTGFPECIGRLIVFRLGRTPRRVADAVVEAADDPHDGRMFFLVLRRGGEIRCQLAGLRFVVHEAKHARRRRRGGGLVLLLQYEWVLKPFRASANVCFEASSSRCAPLGVLLVWDWLLSRLQAAKTSKLATVR